MKKLIIPLSMLLYFVFALSISAQDTIKTDTTQEKQITQKVQKDSVEGYWKTIDDVTHKPKSVVKIWIDHKTGKLFGKIVKLFILPGKNPNPICDKCDKDDPRYNKKVLGMTIITNMVRDGKKWNDGEILDPKKGKVYDCKLWVEDGKLQVRGYILFFYRTQTWLRYKGKI